MTTETSSINIKKDIFDFYETQSSQKTSDIDSWLHSGSPRIPQSRTYYYFEDRKIKNALKMAQIDTSAKILEVGCNLGQMTFPLAQLGYNIVGFDLSENAINKANMRAKYYNLPNIHFEVQDAEDYKGHANGSFDAVFSFSAFRYFPNPAKALLEAHRVLKKNGVIILDFPNKFCPWFKIIKKAAFIKSHIHDNLYSETKIEVMMKRAGFRNITFKKFLFTYKELPSVLLPILKTADFILERTPLIKETAAILMVKGEKA